MNSIGFGCTISLYEPPILGLTEFVGHGIVIFRSVMQTVSLSSYNFTHRINSWEESKLPMRDEYQFDYSKAKPNRFASRIGQDQLMIVLDPDVAAVFKTAESVNTVLRAIITSMPKMEKESN